MKLIIFFALVISLIFQYKATQTKTQTQTQTTVTTQAKTQTQTQTQAKTQAQAQAKTSAKSQSKTETSTSLFLKSQTRTLSKKELEELAKLKALQTSSKFGSKPTNVRDLSNLSNEEREELISQSKKEEESKVPIRNVKTFNLENKQIYWQGWIKFFHYTEYQKIDKPNHFYENPSFFTEHVRYADKDKRDENGNFLYIQDKYHFWSRLLPSGNFNILGSRKNQDTTLADNVENLNTDLIGYVHPYNNANGGIKDLGSFNEGHCLSIKTNVPEPKKNLQYNPRTQPGEEVIWIICTDRLGDKKELMSYLVSLKLKRQQEIDDTGLEEVRKNLSVAEIMKVKPFKPKIDRYVGRGATVDDGYWILLQDWSQCSLKCGGGEKLQQWMCVPPKNQGKPCIGDAVRKKTCNNQPCPETFTNSLMKPDDKTHETLKPIYKAMPYSKRPQQYIKCMIKENDILYVTKEYDPEKKKDIKVPGRIVMNTKTISVYKDDGYVNLLFSFNLEDSVFSKNERDHCCFFLTNKNRQFNLCGFNENCGTPEEPVWVKKWGYDFEYFQHKCYNELREKDPAIKKRKNAAAIPNGVLPSEEKGSGADVEGRREIIEKKLEDSVQKKMDDSINVTQKISLTALRREINLEDIIKNEEIQKGKDETQQLFNQMQQEKKKKELLEQALSTRESNYGKVRIAKDTQKKIAELKLETKVDIKFKRGVLKKKIEEIRNKFRRKHRELKQQIQVIRNEMANEIMGANKRGNKEQCKDARNNLNKIKEYCDRNYITDYVKNMNCKEPQNFCYSCCETEFGNMFIADRDDCQTMCDDLYREDLNNGDYVWQAGKPEEALAPPYSLP